MFLPTSSNTACEKIDLEQLQTLTGTSHVIPYLPLETEEYFLFVLTLDQRRSQRRYRGSSFIYSGLFGPVSEATANGRATDSGKKSIAYKSATIVASPRAVTEADARRYFWNGPDYLVVLFSRSRARRARKRESSRERKKCKTRCEANTRFVISHRTSTQ